MSHECTDCGQSFETLTELRLHDCHPAPETTPSTVSDQEETDAGVTAGSSDPVQVEQLETQLARVEDGEFDVLYRAVATYEAALDTARESDSTDQYRDISRAYRRQLVAALDNATQAEGWEFLAGFLDAYHPETADEFPHVTTILQNVTGRYLIRTRLSDGVDALPTTALAFYSAILDELEGNGYDFVTEGVHPYGWGIGHPDHPVADTIHDHASTDIFVVNPLLEHAFYADQHEAMTLLERIASDNVQREIPARPGERRSATRYLLDAVAGAASDELWPTVPRYWEFHDALDFEFELDATVEQRVRDLVTEKGLDADLPDDWELDDLLV